jgi:hypothetical protein
MSLGILQQRHERIVLEWNAFNPERFPVLPQLEKRVS